MDKKLAVIFPGIGYTVDKPLLYYSRKIAIQNGYEIVELRFDDLDKEALNDRSKMLAVFTEASKQAGEKLDGIDFGQYDDVIFISKSIGTVAASAYAAKRKISARQVYFTPLEQTFSLLEKGNGLVFFGDKDRFSDAEQIEELCRTAHLEYRLFPGANHSLETGELHTDLKNIASVIEETENFLVGSPIYKFKAKTWKGEIRDFSEYRGKVLLIVNSATGCGFTPQYEALEELYKRYRREGFEILDFPCNQFGHQAPGSDNEIHSFCSARYDVSFTQFSRIDVNGEKASEIFTYLKSRQGFRGFLRNSKESIYLEKKVAEMDPDYLHNSDIKWNFTKFLVDRHGKVVDRFEPDAGCGIVEQAVEREL